MPRYDPERLGIRFGHLGGVEKSAAVREGSGVANERKHTLSRHSPSDTRCARQVSWIGNNPSPNSGHTLADYLVCKREDHAWSPFLLLGHLLFFFFCLVAFFSLDYLLLSPLFC